METTVFTLESDARKAFPEAFKDLDKENKMQNPGAKFTRAESEKIEEDDVIQLTVMYDIGDGRILETMSIIDCESGDTCLDEYFEVES